MAVPDVPLFTVMATELPDCDHEPLSGAGVNPSRCCSLRRQERRERRARRQGSHRVQQQQSHQVKAVVHSQTGLSDSGTVTDVPNQCRHSGKQSRKLLVAELEKMKKENEALKTEEKELHSKLSDMQNEREHLLGNVENLTALKTEKKELQQDVFMLKNLVIRLNVELERAQDKLHNIKSSATDITAIGDEPCSSESNKGPVRAPLWGRSEMNVVAPLLQAYQETVEDRDQLIMSYRREIEHFTARCKTIVAENESLHQELIEANKKGEVTYTEWQSVQMEAAMTRDQNELLLRQAKLNQNKLNDLHSAYHSKISELTVDRDQTQERLSKTQAELFVLRGRCSVLQEECDNLKSDSSQKIPVSVHKAAVEECKRLFEELKQRYDSERDNLIRKVASLEAGRPDVDIQLVNITAERDQLVAEYKASEKLNKRQEEKISELEGRLQQCERSRNSLKQQLNQAMAFARELISEQELLATQLAERRSVVKLGSDIAARVGNLRLRLKGVEREACKELDGMEQKFRQQASSLDRMKEHFSHEINRMKTLIEEKNSLIQQLKLEKSKVEDQLEVVWKAAMSDKIEDKGDSE